MLSFGVHVRLTADQPTDLSSPPRVLLGINNNNYSTFTIVAGYSYDVSKIGLSFQCFASFNFHNNHKGRYCCYHTLQMKALRLKSHKPVHRQ